MPSPGIEILPLHLKQQPLDFQPTICPPASDFLPVGPTLSRLFPRVRGHCGLQAGSPPDPAAGEVSPLQRPALAPGHVCVVQDQHPGCPRTPPTARTCLRRPSQGSLAQGRIPLYPQMPVVCPHPGPYPEPWLLPGSWILHQIKVLKPPALGRSSAAPLPPHCGTPHSNPTASPADGPRGGRTEKARARIRSGSSQIHGGKSFWGPCGALPVPRLANTHRPSRPRSADAPAGPGPESHLCSAPVAPAPRTPASRARLTASPFQAAAARGAPWPGPRCSSRGPAPPIGPAPPSPAPAGSAALLNPGPEPPLASKPQAPGSFRALRCLSHSNLRCPKFEDISSSLLRVQTHSCSD